MASAKELKKKIRSISNTRKITRTMELVATVKSKRTQTRVQATTPYVTALGELLGDLGKAGTIRHPLLEVPAKKLPTVVLVLTANRGLCGGYNTNVMALAETVLKGEQAAGRPTEIYMSGKKGIARMRFLKLQPKERFMELDDKAGFGVVERLADGLIRRFLLGEIGKVLVVSTRFLSAASHVPQVAQLLPIADPAASGDTPATQKAAAPRSGTRGAAAGEAKAPAAVDYIFEPDPRTILEALLPLSVKVLLFRLVVESAAGEQAARRLAMKLATDNAEEMISYYSRFYNRTRQASITQQINEIVSGANALE